MLKNKDIIIISNQSYHDRYWTSKQYITQELIKENRVLYIDGNYSFGKMAKAITGEKWPITFWGKLKKKNDKLFVFTPPPRLPLRNHFRFISKIHQYILLRSIKNVMRKIEIKNPVVWSFLHSTNDLVGKLDEEIFIYHCVDDWQRLIPLAKMGRAKQINRDEEDLAEKVDICFCTAKFLRDKIIRHNENTFYTPNAAAKELFSKAKSEQTKIPLDIAHFKGPIIIFIGNFEQKVNVNLLCKIFSEKSNWKFISLGLTGNTKEILDLSALPNVHLLGMKPKEALPGYLKKADVAIIPFYINELGKSISPLKLFEYFAAGKPVVAADLPEISRFSNLVWLARTAEDYIEAIGEALQKKEDPEYLKALAIAAEEKSWPERIKTYSAAIEQILTEDSLHNG